MPQALADEFAGLGMELSPRNELTVGASIPVMEVSAAHHVATCFYTVGGGFPLVSISWHTGLDEADAAVIEEFYAGMETMEMGAPDDPVTAWASMFSDTVTSADGSAVHDGGWVRVYAQDVWMTPILQSVTQHVWSPGA